MLYVWYKLVIVYIYGMNNTVGLYHYSKTIVYVPEIPRLPYYNTVDLRSVLHGSTLGTSRNSLCYQKI